MHSSVDVALPARLRLTHGCLEYLARSASVRILHVKGVALHPVLSARRAPSTDCDVLVHPDRVDTFCDQLTAYGWEMVTSFRHGSVFEHAATFYNPVWGTVDVHRTFPGLDVDPRATFERLWADRATVDLGGVSCAVPDLLGQRVVLLAHAARDAMGRRGHDVEVAWTAASDEDRERIDELADALGGTVPVALATGRGQRSTGLRDEHLWRAVHRGADPSDVWAARLRDATTLRRRAHILIAALHVNPDHLGLRLGHAPDRQELRQEWRDRWTRLFRRALRFGRAR